MDKFGLFQGGTKLRGANIFQNAEGPPWYPSLVKQDIKNLKLAGANLVNLSVPGIFNVMGDKDLNVEYLNRLTEILNWCDEVGIFCIISFRTGPGRSEGDITSGLVIRDVFKYPDCMTAYANMWQYAAVQFQNYPCVVGYDIMVEPHDVEIGVWRYLAQKVIEYIRRYDKVTPIIVSPDNWGVADSLDYWTPMFGQNLVYSIHQYEPYSYTMETGSFDAKYKTLTTKIQKIDSWKKKYLAPIIVNEFGLKLTRPRADKFLDKELSLLESIGVNHAVWLWEVSDPSYNFRVMDVSSDLVILSILQKYWAKNQPIT